MGFSDKSWLTDRSIKRIPISFPLRNNISPTRVFKMAIDWSRSLAWTAHGRVEYQRWRANRAWRSSLSRDKVFLVGESGGLYRKERGRVGYCCTVLCWPLRLHHRRGSSCNPRPAWRCWYNRQTRSRISGRIRAPRHPFHLKNKMVVSINRTHIIIICQNCTISTELSYKLKMYISSQ